jgi:hypothetical protein
MPPNTKSLTGDLGVFIPGIGHAQFLAEKAHHLRRVAKGALAIVLSAGRHIPLHWETIHHLRALAELSDHQGHQVGRVRLVLQPVIGDRCQPPHHGWWTRACHWTAQNRAAARSRSFLSWLFVRCVKAGEPVARVFVLTLAPDLQPVSVDKRHPG